MFKNFNPIAWVVTAVVVIVPILMFLIMRVNYNNLYSRLEAEAAARQDVSKITFDTTWKIIQGQAQVATTERESFKTTFIEIMNSRTQNDQNLIMKWSQEAQVPISADLYKALQNSIESQRGKFLNAQKELIDIRREAENARNTFPGSMFLGGRAPIKINIVTSEKTDKVFETGKEDNVDVFGK